MNVRDDDRVARSRSWSSRKPDTSADVIEDPSQPTSVGADGSLEGDPAGQDGASPDGASPDGSA